MVDVWKLNNCPLPHNRERGHDAVQPFGDLSQDKIDLIKGSAGSSPYLDSIVKREPEFVRHLLNSDPSEVLQSLLRETRSFAPDQLSTGLRTIKRRVALLTAFADLGAVWTLEQVTEALSDFADAAVDVAIKAMVRREARLGKLPGVTEEQADCDAGGIAVLAMGKMGAGELNYSSDIDLICLFDESRYSVDDYHDARASLIRATRGMAKLLSEITGDGYVFRTDLRLRPDPSVTPVCMSMDAAERYYESLGRTWERAAYIKARAAAGDKTAGQEFLDRLRPFVWRKHLDFAAIEDAHDMRLRIREHKGTGGPITLENHNMKLGRGGIREIEFFTQTRQIIAGGRDDGLRDRRTVVSLDDLSQKGWVEPELAQRLTAHYRAHREVEHRIQMVADEQTHDLPGNDDGFLRLAHMMGREDVDQLRAEIRERLEDVHQSTESFFAPDADTRNQVSGDHRETIARILRLPALRSSRAQESFKRLSPVVFEKLDATAHPGEAIAAFEKFLSGLPAGVQLFALFEANPHLVDLIIDIVGTAPALADYLGRNSGVLDAVIGGAFFSEWPGQSQLEQDLCGVLEKNPDYETSLDAARRFMKEWHFRIGVHHLRGLITAFDAGAQYADLAQAVIRALWPIVVAEFSRKHGNPPGRGAAVIAMGSLGSGRLNAGSDLDLIVIYDDQGVEESEGRRPLAARTYYARLTQALVTALSAPMAEGKLYEVDMRLRPSGRKGPVATAFPSFKNYQRDEAWGWEHLALTRANPIAGSPDLLTEIETFRNELLKAKGDVQTVLKSVSEMRARLNEARPRRTVWDVKAGSGGLMDIELCAQAAALVCGEPIRDTIHQLECTLKNGWLSQGQVDDLSAAYRLLWQVKAGQKLLIADKFDVKAIGSGGRAFLCSGMSQPEIDDLACALEKTYETVAKIIDPLVEQTG